MPDLPTATSDATARVQAINDAVMALQRGLPAVLGGTAEPAVAVLCAERVDEAGAAALDRAATGPRTLLLSAERAAAVLPHLAPSAAVVALDAQALSLGQIRAFADPLCPPAGLGDPPRLVPPPDHAAAALALAVLARRLPALLCVPAAGRVGPPARDVTLHGTLSAQVLERVSEAVVPLEDVADARMVAFRATQTGAEHFAILIGRPEDASAALVRVHSECFTGDLLGSLRCDCGPQLRGAIQRMAAEGAGALLYLAQEGRGIGLVNKLRAYALQDRGLDTVDANRALGFAADERDFQVAAAMLRQLGLTRIRLLTNNPEKIAVLAANGIEIAGRESLLFAANGVNDRYVRAKATRFGHFG